MWLKPGIIAAASGSGSSPSARRTPPPYFFAGGPLPVKLVYNANGATAADRYSTNYSSATFRNTGTTYYVATTGNDSTGDGSSGNPWATLQKANDTAAAGSQIMIADGRYAPVSITKNISFIAQSSGKVYVGTFIKNADVSSWGTLSNGQQTITLAASGIIVHGFVDLMNTYPSYLGGSPIVAQYCSSTSGITSNQALGRAGILFSYSAGVNSVLGASDKRDLTNKFDTEILAWAKNSPAPLAVAGGVQFYSSGIYWVGGKQRTVGTSTTVATMIMEGGGGLGMGSDDGLSGTNETDQVFEVHGTFVGKSTVIIGSNIPYQDGLDFYSAQKGKGAFIDSYLGQCGETSGVGTQAITMHNGIGFLVVNCTLFDNQQDFGDVGPVVHGIFNVRHRGGRYSSGNALNLIDTTSEFHIADFTMVDPATGDAGQIGGAMFDYDGSTIGLQLPVTTGVLYQWKGLTDQTGDAIISQITVNKQYLFQDAGGTVPVTASGQTVARINDASVSGQYYLVTLGTVTYTESTLNSLTFGGTNGAVIQLNGRADPFGTTDIFMGVKTSDTSFDFVSSPAPGGNPPIFGMSWTSGLVPWQNDYAGVSSTIKVDGVTKTSKTNLSTAVANGAAHVFTVDNADMNYYRMRQVVLLGSSPTGTTYSYTGELYGIIIARHTGNTTTYNAYKATIQTASGL